MVVAVFVDTGVSSGLTGICIPHSDKLLNFWHWDAGGQWAAL
jgi:hypothetical protein